MDINNIVNKEEKEKIVEQILDKVKDNETIGFGSGSTSYLAVIKIVEKVKKENLKIKAVTTSDEIEKLCKDSNIETVSLVEANLDWAFDGADEVDQDNNMIKGMGRAMFKEKLNILASPKTYILVDKTKFVEHLGEKHPVPIEVFPSAIKYVANELEKIGATETVFRGMTDNNNAILDTRFKKITKELEKQIKLIPGVIESGLFMGYNVEIIKNNCE